MRTLYIALFALLSFVTSSSSVMAQFVQFKEMSQEMSDIQKEKSQFTYGFYMAYMSGIVYNVKGLPDMLLKAYVDKDVIKRQTDSDILLNAQDCIEQNMRTLKVEPIDDDWYKVSFVWPSFYENIPTSEHVMKVRVDEKKKRYKITEIKYEVREIPQKKKQ